MLWKVFLDRRVLILPIKRSRAGVMDICLCKLFVWEKLHSTHVQSYWFSLFGLRFPLSFLFLLVLFFFIILVESGLLCCGQWITRVPNMYFAESRASGDLCLFMLDGCRRFVQLRNAMSWNLNLGLVTTLKWLDPSVWGTKAKYQDTRVVLKWQFVYR